MLRQASLLPCNNCLRHPRIPCFFTELNKSRCKINVVAAVVDNKILWRTVFPLINGDLHVFVIGIGSELSDGYPHDGRSADYDDWSSLNEDGYKGLNGDLLLWNPVLESAFEVSSMGIRVDEQALARQLELRGEMDKSGLMYHKALLEGRLPYTIGGGIGQSRLCMFLLRKAHIGEIQSSVWPEEMREKCRMAGIDLV